MKKFKRRKTEYEDFLINLKELESDYVNIEKISTYSDDYTRDVKNYILFQRFPYFRWPLWLQSAITTSSNLFNPISPIHLSNRINRNYISFSNVNSTEEIRVDPSGMLSPSYDCWSIEFWIYTDNVLHRPQNGLDSAIQKKDVNTSVISTVWREKDFEMSEEVFGISTNIDEAVVEIRSTLKRKIDFALLLLVVRPYNIISISGIESIEYKKASRVIGVNGYDRIAVSKSPDLVLSGSGNDGDIRIIRSGKDIFKSRCQDKMATLALGYKLVKGDNNFRFRLCLSRDKNIKPAKLNLVKLKKNFIDNANLKAKRGFNLNVPDELFRNWFYASKISLLNSANPDNYHFKSDKVNSFDMKSVFYITMGYNRMGYFEESLNILDSFLSDNSMSDSKCFTDVLDGCYFVNSISDYFTISRNIDYLQLRYSRIKGIATKIYENTSRIKNINKWIKKNRNSIKDCVISDIHFHDVMLISSSLRQFSYLSRCMGLFGEEIKFNKEADRLEKIILSNISGDFIKTSEKADDEIKSDIPNVRNEFFIYNIFAGFPFKLNLANEENLKQMINLVKVTFKEFPIFIKSFGGWDSFLSIITAINLLLVKDGLSYDILLKLMDAGRDRFVIPEIMSPVSGIGIFGDGDSKVVLSLFFILLRNTLYIDYESRLEIFPVPNADWFVAGKEIVISKAPSRFGYLNFKIITTRNEIQLHFDELPKYLPPDILINLPFKTKIIKMDDFIIKKEFGNSFLISGWPSVIRFLRS